MIRIFKLVVLLVISQVAFGQAPSNYTNINGRYRWIAGMFDSTFHIPKGTTPSLRTGGSTNAGALFYRTSDSTVRYWTGSQWLTLSDTTRFVPYVGATKDVDLDTWSLNAKSLHIKGTAGQGHLGLKFQSATPNMSANESGVYADANGNLGVKIDNAYTSIFKTSLNSADRTYTFQNKSYTVGDSSDIAARVKYTDTASMLSPYLRSNVAAATYVPYTGAITNVNLGVRTLTASGLYIANTNALFGRNAANNSDYSLIGITGADKVYIDAGNLGTTIGGPLTLATLNNATVDTDAFLVSDGGVVKYRTGTQLLSDIGAASSSSISGTTNYIPKFTSSSAIGNSLLTDNGIELRYTGADGFRVQGSTDGFLSVYGTANNYLQFIDGGGASGYIRYNHTSDFMSFQTAGSERMRLDASGNLGINTSSPAAKLDVQGSSSDQIRLRTAATEYYSIGRNASTGFLDFYGSQSGYVGYVWGGVNGTRMTLDASGNLGLGTSSPATKLQVYKSGTSVARFGATNYVDINQDGFDSYASGSASTMYINYYSGGAVDFLNGKMLLNASGNLGLGVSPSAWRSIDKVIQIGNAALWNESNAQTWLANNTYENSVGQYIYINSAGATAYNQYNGSHIWYTAPSGTAGNTISFTQAMTLDASGRLGIGNTNPSTKLEVAGIIRGEAVNVYGSTDPASTSPYLYSPSTGALGFGANGSERMRITSGGNVGIGITSPTSLLHINSGTTGTQTVANFAAANYGSSSSRTYIQIGTQYGDGSSRIGSINTTGNQSALVFQTQSASSGVWNDAMYINGSGNVGIGTTSPNSILQIKGAFNIERSNTTDYSIIDNEGNLNIKAATGGGGGSFNTVFFTNGSERMRITSGGNIGIGSTNPDRLLVISASNPNMSIKSTTTTGFSELYFGDSAADLGWLGYAHNGDYMYFGVNNSERMRITSGGNVNINTSNPSGRYLSIGGDISVGSNNTNTYELLLQMNSSYARIGPTYQTGGSYVPLTFWTSDAERMRITSGGEVYIAGTTDQGAYNLQVNGTGVWGAGAYVNGSDSALKQNIQPLDNSLDLIKQMKPVTYTYKEFYSKDTSVQTGFIAQDLQELLKDKNYLNGIVKDGTYLSIAYQNLIPLLVKAIQEQQLQIENLKNK